MSSKTTRFICKHTTYSRVGMNLLCNKEDDMEFTIIVILWVCLGRIRIKIELG